MAKKHYSVYERGTDRPIYIYGTADECAAALGVAVRSFHTYVSKLRGNHGGVPQWIEIFCDDTDNQDDEE